MSAMLRALVYNRVSKDATGRRISTASQDRENRAYCTSQGWEVVAAITDDARSASRYATKEREGYAEALDAIAGRRYGRVDVLVLTAADRAERRLDGHVELRRLLAEHAVLLAYKGKVYDLRLGGDRFAAGLDALVAEREADDIRDRTLRSHRASIERGTPRGAIPYGYIHEYSPATGAMTGQVPDPESAPVVREVAVRVLRGDTLYGIAADLNARGVPTPLGRRELRAGRESARLWTTTGLRQMLSRPQLTGMRTHHGLVVAEGTWEPIIDPADWAKIQAILTDPARSVAPRGQEPRHLLSGIAECGVCGGLLRPIRRRGRDELRCGGRTHAGPKGHVSRLEAALDEFVTRPLLRRLGQPASMKLLCGPDDESGHVEAQAELADLRARLAGFVESAVAGGISPTSFAAIESRLLAQIAELEQRAVPRSVPAAVAELVLGDPVARWEQWGSEPGGVGKRRQVVRRFLPRIVVHRSSRGVVDASTVDLMWRAGPRA